MTAWLGTIGLALAVAAMAAAGSVLRSLIGRRLNDEFPFGTLVANLISSAALGVISAADDPLPVIIGIGALGALSTWSTAANEAADLARQGAGSLAAGYLGLTVSAGIVAAWVGLQVGQQLF
jgi:CrcB protein